MTSQGSDTVTSIFKFNSSKYDHKFSPAKNGLVFISTSQFLGIRVFYRQRKCCFYTAGCVNRMAVSVTGPRAGNELGGPVIPGK